VPDAPSLEPVFRSDVTVELVKHTASDADVLFAARVSTLGEQSIDEIGKDPERSKGLINYLMRDRHGCYDDETEVLTRAGWKRWPDVDGTEEFLTVNRVTGVQEYQRALRVIHKPWDGEMIRIKGMSTDLLVTPDHKMLAAARTHKGWHWNMHDAWELHYRCHKVPLAFGRWVGERSVDSARMALLGFFIGDGNLAASIEFHLRRPRKIAFLHEAAEACGFRVTQHGDRYRLLTDADFRLLAKRSYTSEREKTVPAELLDSSPESLTALLDGLMASDGHTAQNGRRTYTTTSAVLRDQVQEIAAKIGTAATWRLQVMGAGHFGTKPVFQMTIYKSRKLHQRIGWTRADRDRQVRSVQYKGMVHCVTVPNGIVYVRRNGMPLWCGNSPFEHNSMTFLISAPIFVFREFMRHRVGWSYNEESGRYRELQPVFYIPGPDRRLVQVGKAGHYRFEPGTAAQHELVDRVMVNAYRQAYDGYQAMLAAGVAREVARSVLPVGLYSSAYATCNARSLMHFLGLRTTHPAAAIKSSPQREIEMVAEKMEAEWARLMPLTHAAFNANGRIAP
jgi:thymidylate synthase (FAD)